MMQSYNDIFQGTGQSVFIETPHYRHAAKVWGPVNGIPVIAAHGWLDNAASFDAIAPLLPQLRILALDVIGHARSDWRPAGASYHFVDYVRDIMQVADAVGWETFVFLGHSMGAGIGTLVAGAFPKRITHFIAIDALGPLSMDPEECPDMLRRSIEEQEIWASRGTGVYTKYEDAVVVRQKSGGFSYASAEILAARGVEEVEDGYTWKYDPRLKMLSPMRLMENQVVSFIQNIQAPTLFIRAKDGYPIPPQMMQQRNRAVPNLCYVEVTGGHHAHLENPNDVVKEIQSFLGQ